VLLGGFHN